MNLSDGTLAVFVREGWEHGILAAAVERAQKATMERMKANPADPVANAKAQAEYEVWAKDIPSIAEEVDEFRAKYAPAKGQP